MKAPTVIRHASPAAMAAAARDVVQRGKAESEWYGPKNWDQTLEALEGRGCAKIGGEVRDMVQAITAAMPAPPRPYWVRRPAGVFPSVPAYLAGSPAAMMDRRRVQAGPVRVVASVWASSGWSPEKITARGAAVAALVARWARVRPVELWISAEMGCPEVIELCRVPTAPLDVDAVGYALAGVGAFRRVMMGMQYARAKAEELPYRGEWTTFRGAARPTEKAWPDKVRQALGLKAEDVYVGPMFGNPSGRPEVTDPAAWIVEVANG